MKTVPILLSALLIAWLPSCKSVYADNEPPADTVIESSAEDRTGSITSNRELPSLEPYAKNVLKQMSDYIAAAKQFSFHGEVTEEEVLSSGVKLQLAASVEVVVQRPNRIWADVRDDYNHKRFWYDGRSMTMLTVPANLYAASTAPPHIDAALNLALERHGIALPLEDFLFSSPYEVLMKEVTGGFYAGLHAVNGVACHHLVFTQEQIDWQIWIEEGRQKVPRKLVITNKNEPGMPQFIAYLSDWDFSPHVPEQMFVFEVPPGAEEIEFLEFSE